MKWITYSSVALRRQECWDLRSNLKLYRSKASFRTRAPSARIYCTVSQGGTTNQQTRLAVNTRKIHVTDRWSRVRTHKGSKSAVIWGSSNTTSSYHVRPSLHWSQRYPPSLPSRVTLLSVDEMEQWGLVRCSRPDSHDANDRSVAVIVRSTAFYLEQ